MENLMQELTMMEIDEVNGGLSFSWDMDGMSSGAIGGAIAGTMGGAFAGVPGMAAGFFGGLVGGAIAGGLKVHNEIENLQQ
jgi:fructose-specific phosphotransferase system IIC component